MTVLKAEMEIYKEKEVVWAVVDTGWYAIYKITSPWNAVGSDWHNPWNNPGGDFDGAICSDTVHYIDQGIGWQKFNVTEMVQGFVESPSTNYGFFVNVAMDDPAINFEINRTDTVYQASTYFSAGSSQKDKRPKLTVTYSTDPTGINVPETVSGKQLGITVKGRSIKAVGLGKGKIDIQITDILGRRIADVVSGRMNQWFRIPDGTPSGIYFVSIKSQKKNAIKKFKYAH